MPKPIAALVYDFDMTLAPHFMQEYQLLPIIGIEPAAFWRECRVFAEKHQTDSVLAYLYMFIEKSRELGVPLTRDLLRRCGEAIEFYPGIEDWFRRINEYGRRIGVAVEHYLLSSGMKEIVEGTKIAGEFKAIFASSYAYDDQGAPIWAATAVNYTSKTQYMYRINKGILDVTNDADLNAYTPRHRRRVPYENMIYIGDGMTDVPCMKLAKSKGGCAIAVYEGEGNRVTDEMIQINRVDFAVPADYREGSLMDLTVKTQLRQILAVHDHMEIHNAQLEQAENRGPL